MTHKITREYEKKMSEISPFELKNILIDLADESARKSTHIMLNAGRGNRTGSVLYPAKPFPARPVRTGRMRPFLRIWRGNGRTGRYPRKETYRHPFHAIPDEARRLSRYGTAERHLRLSCE